MPTERFNRLEEKKRQLICDAVLNEFQQTAFGEMKISRIARRAQISRGSLYTYFDGKEDMFSFALQETWRELNCYDEECLIREHGNYWNMLPRALEHRVQTCTANQLSRLLFFAPETRVPQCCLTNDQMREAVQDYEQRLYERLDSSWRNCTKEEFQEIHGTCHALMMMAIQEILFHREEKRTAMETFKQRVQLIKRQQKDRNQRGDRL